MLYKHLQYFPELADQVPGHVLKELCSAAQLDKCPEEDYRGEGCSFGYTVLLTCRIDEIVTADRIVNVMIFWFYD